MLLGDCQRRLVILWLALALPAFVIIIIRSVSSEQPYVVDGASLLVDVWAWLLSSIMPTLTLILGVMAAGAVYGEDEKPRMRYVLRFMFHIAFALSAFYLIIIDVLAFVWVGQPSILKTTSLYLSPLQSLLGAALGAFFVSTKPAKDG